MRSLALLLVRVLGVAVLLTAVGCADQAARSQPPSQQSSADRSGSPSPPRLPSAELPPADAVFDYQLGGVYPPSAGVTVVARDSTADPVEGAYNICYVNGFQTQPGDEWPTALLLTGDDGAPTVDPDWPDEHILDIGSDANRRQIAARLSASIDSCVAAGFDAVELDNLDTFTRFDDRISKSDAIAYAKILVARAHASGLAVAQKNSAELGAAGRDEAGFDFAVTEECDRQQECSAFADVFGVMVFNIEYTDDLRGTQDEVCARNTTPTSTIIRDRDLVPAGDNGYSFRACQQS